MNGLRPNHLHDIDLNRLTPLDDEQAYARNKAPSAGQHESPLTIVATPFEWIEPSAIPERDWIYDWHFIRKFISETVSHSGVAKSTKLLAEAMAIATNRDLLGVKPRESVRVWYWNGEDPMEELQRRLMAIAIHYEITREEIAGRLFVDTGRKTKIVVAEQTKAGTVIRRPVMDALKRTIERHEIGLLVIDPFVSCHAVPENDTIAIQAVATEWAELADATNIAVELVHHSRKTGGGEVTVEDGRGSVALLAKARSARVHNGMTRDEAAKYGIKNRHLFFRVDNGKANLYVPPDEASWFKLVSVPLGNGPLGSDGDSIGVVTAWEPPNPLDNATTAHLRAVQKLVASQEWRKDIRAPDWVGRAVAEVMKLEVENPADRNTIKGLLHIWTENGMFKVVSKQDDKRRLREFVEVDQWATD